MGSEMCIRDRFTTLYAVYHPVVRSVVVRCLPPHGALCCCGGTMLTSVETSVFAGCDLGISGLIMAFRCKGRCIWTRTTGTDIGNDRGATNFELILVAGWASPRPRDMFSDRTMLIFGRSPSARTNGTKLVSRCLRVGGVPRECVVGRGRREMCVCVCPCCPPQLPPWKLLIRKETSVFAYCDLGRSRVIKATIRFEGRCIWSRTTGADTEIGPESPG